jgi:hypothetical protein
VLPDAVKAVAGPVLIHRILTTSQTRVRGRAAGEVLAKVQAPVPVEETWAVEASGRRPPGGAS